MIIQQSSSDHHCLENLLQILFCLVFMNNSFICVYDFFPHVYIRRDCYICVVCRGTVYISFCSFLLCLSHGFSFSCLLGQQASGNVSHRKVEYLFQKNLVRCCISFHFIFLFLLLQFKVVITFLHFVFGNGVLNKVLPLFILSRTVFMLCLSSVCYFYTFTFLQVL